VAQALVLAASALMPTPTFQAILSSDTTDMMIGRRHCRVPQCLLWVFPGGGNRSDGDNDPCSGRSCRSFLGTGSWGLKNGCNHLLHGLTLWPRVVRLGPACKLSHHRPTGLFSIGAKPKSPTP